MPGEPKGRGSLARLGGKGARSLARSLAPHSPAVLSAERDGKRRGGVAGVAAPGEGSGGGERRRGPGSAGGRRAAPSPGEACYSGEFRQRLFPSPHPAFGFARLEALRGRVAPPALQRSARSSRPRVVRRTGKGLGNKTRKS